jgi:hypothetical protein
MPDRTPERLAMALGLALTTALAPAQEPAPATPWEGPHHFRPVERGEPTRLAFGVAVYGGTPAGVTAAVQAARMGKRTVLLSFDRHVGGVTSGGLTATDIGDEASVGGLARAAYDRLGRIRDFSPSRAEALFRNMLDEAGVTVLLARPLESAQLDGARVLSITMMTGETIDAEVFIDASYEGDLMAAAEVSYRVGREPRSAFGESLAGQWQTVSWRGVYQFCDLPISPYTTPGDPASGLLPEIAAEPPGEPGQGDHRVQAYNFRMHLSRAPDRVAFPRPPGYDPDRYALLARFLRADADLRWTLDYTTRPRTDGPVQMRDGDSNNAGSFSSDHVGGNYRWPDGTYEPGSFDELPPPRRGMPVPLPELHALREAIFRDHVDYQVGLMHFLANDPRVPAELRARVDRFGLAPDEFNGTGHWPHALYVREGRRMVSDYVVTQADCESERVADDPVGLASYPMDSHFCQRVVVARDGVTTVRNEGGFGHPCPGPYPVSYRALVPKKRECENLLVPVALSASHVAFGSIRMEPVFMILGQSAGTAASLAIDAGVSVQDLDYAALRRRLLEDGQRL